MARSNDEQNGERKMYNGLFSFVLALLFGLIVGSYGYTFIAIDKSTDRIERRLDRIENLIRWPGNK